jgi:hypothetical protein
MKSQKCVLGVVLIMLLVFSNPLNAEVIGKDVKITHLGHSAFKIVSPKGATIYVDPFLSQTSFSSPMAMATIWEMLLSSRRRRKGRS